MNAPVSVDDRSRRGHRSGVAGQIAALAGLYFAAGWLGLLAVVPPGYATPIWPPSGIAMGAVLVAGHRIWPGIFLGAAALNVFNAEVTDISTIAVACTIAMGSTLQSVAGAGLVRKLMGSPVRCASLVDIGIMMAVAGPLACLIAASIGQAALFAADITETQEIWVNWLTWWFGDTLGVLVFLPLTLLSPWYSGSAVLWKGRPLVKFSFSALATVLVALGLTFFAWFTAQESAKSKNFNAFRKIAADSESALLHRMNKYALALEAGAGYFSVDNLVTTSDWQAFTETFDVERNLPGINGIGFIQPLRRDEIDAFEASKAEAGLQRLTIHPETSADALFVITLIEPIGPNIKAVGLDIAFEENRRSAAIIARDEGISTITRRIFLVQDDVRRAGFLMLRPLYTPGMPIGNVEERRAAFRGWIYAPFIGQNFLEGLTASQDGSLTISVYDGSIVDPDAEIYSSPKQHSAKASPLFRVTKSIPIMDHEWTVVWESSPAFEAANRRREAEIVLASGLALSGFLAALLISLTRRETSIREKVIEKTALLAAREKEYSSIFDTAAVAILLVDCEGRILKTNTAARQLFGGAVEKTIFDILDVPEENATDPSPWLLDSCHRKALVARGADGGELFVEMEASRWTTTGGADRLTLILLDVTEETRTTEDLAESELRLDLVLEGTGVGVYDADLKEKAMAVSQTWRAIFGFGEGDEIEPGKEWLDRVHSEDLPSVLENTRRCICGEVRQARAEYRIRRNDGNTIWVRSVSFVSKRDADGRALRITGTLVDIQEQKRALESLELSEARFRTAMKNAPIGEALVMVTDEIADANDALSSFLGYERDELLQLRFSDLVHEEDVPKSARHATSAILGAMPQSDLRFMHKDGHEVWGMLTSSLVESSDNSESYAIVQILDVDERRKIDKMKREFIAAVSHELRTPLTAVRGSLGMMRMSVGNTINAGTDRLITIAQNNCDRLLGLVNDILDLEKLVSGNMEIELEPVEATEFVKEIVADLSPYSTTQGVSIEIAGTGDPCMISTNRDRFTQILSNLISNAVKFSSEGSVVTVGVETQQAKAIITVSDTGPGIPLEFQERIFSRFAQANSTNTRNTGGTGLGLNISKELVDSMGGQIGFDSTESHGTTFWFSFPLIRSQKRQFMTSTASG